MKKQAKRHIPQVEPVFVGGEELIERLLGCEGVTRNGAEATIRAMGWLGLRVVQMCQLCAEPQPPYRPACPNVASVTTRATRGETLLQGELHTCLPHSRGEKVHAPSRAARLREERSRGLVKYKEALKPKARRT